MELDTFLGHLFGDVPEDQVVGIVQRGWVTTAYIKGRTKIRPDAASYYCISTLKKPEANEPLRRLMPNMAQTYVIVCDDIGTKIDAEKFKGKPLPHYVMETSAGNHQYGYKFKGTLEQAQVLIEALIEAGYSDPGARDVHRLVRLPGSLNYKYNPPFASRLVEENWDEPSFTFEEMAAEFGVTPREPTSLRTTKRAWVGDPEGDVIFKWMTEQGMVLSEPNAEGWAFIECPWGHEHSDGRTDAKWQLGAGATGNWKCFHAACQSRTQGTFRLWCESQNAPDFDYVAVEHAKAIAARIATIPPGVFATTVAAPPIGARAGDIIRALVLKYAPCVDKGMLPSLEMSKNGPKGEQKPVAENVQYIIEQCGFSVMRNHMTGEIELSHPDEAFNGLASPEEHITVARELLISLAQRVGISLRATCSEVLNALAAGNGYHPTMVWVRSKPWDGVDRIKALCATIETDNTKWRDTVIRKWCLQAIAAWTNWEREQPIPISQVMVLVGPQGCGKSSFVGSLLPERWRQLEQSAHLGHANSRDDERRLLSAPITELAEVEVIIGRAEAGALKSFISRPVDKIRLPYDRHVTVRPRCTAFVATVNDTEFLSDPTGARRWWPLEVKSCDARHKIDMQQFWAQILHLFEQGERWQLDSDETAQHAVIVEEHRVVSNAEGRLEELKTRMLYVAKSDWTFATPSDICRYYRLDNNYMNSRTAGVVLKKLFGKKTSNNGRKGWRVPIKASEMAGEFSPYIAPETDE